MHRKEVKRHSFDAEGEDKGIYIALFLSTEYAPLRRHIIPPVHRTKSCGLQHPIIESFDMCNSVEPAARDTVSIPTGKGSTEYSAIFILCSVLRSPYVVNPLVVTRVMS